MLSLQKETITNVSKPPRTVSCSLMFENTSRLGNESFLTYYCFHSSHTTIRAVWAYGGLICFQRVSNQIAVKATNQAIAVKDFFGYVLVIADVPHYPFVAVATIGRVSCQIFFNTLFPKSYSPLARGFPLLPYHFAQHREKMGIYVRQLAFYHIDSKIVYPPTYHRVEQRYAFVHGDTPCAKIKLIDYQIFAY